MSWRANSEHQENKNTNELFPCGDGFLMPAYNPSKCLVEVVEIEVNSLVHRGADISGLVGVSRIMCGSKEFLCICKLLDMPAY